MKKRVISMLLLAALAIAGCSTPEETYTSVTVLSVSGTVNIDRADNTLEAREGMRLVNLDTVRTGAASADVGRGQSRAV